MQKRIIVLLFMFALALLFQNCSMAKGSGHTGTETGNSVKPPEGSGPVAGFAAQLVNAVCTTANRCNTNVNVQTCSTGLMAMNGLPQQLGIRGSTGMTTLGQLATQEPQSQANTPATPAAEACLTQISTLSCASLSGNPIASLTSLCANVF